MSLERWEERLTMVPSERRAEVLVEAVRASSKRQGRELLRDWFYLCDALAPWRHELREQFERVGYVSDTAARPTMPATVYRAAWEDDATEEALSWTLDRAVAERFCRYLTGIRAKLVLGIYRDDVDAMIFQGTALGALGYITGRQEAELIPTKVVDIHPIAKLVTVEEVGVDG